MKPKNITKQRILEAIKKANSFRKNSIDSNTPAVVQLAKIGINRITAKSFEQPITDTQRHKDQLEFSYLDVSPDIDSLAERLAKWEKDVDEKHRFLTKIEEIQKYHNISGLASQMLLLPDMTSITQFWQFEDDPISFLCLIDPDKALLAKEAPKIIHRFFSSTSGLETHAVECESEYRLFDDSGLIHKDWMTREKPVAAIIECHQTDKQKTFILSVYLGTEGVLEDRIAFSAASLRFKATCNY